PCARAAALMPPFGTPCSPVFVRSKRKETSRPPRRARGIGAASCFEAVVPNLMPCAPPPGVITTARTASSSPRAWKGSTSRRASRIPCQRERCEPDGHRGVAPATVERTQRGRDDARPDDRGDEGDQCRQQQKYGTRPALARQRRCVRSTAGEREHDGDERAEGGDIHDTACA